jgi:hypothetical protein
MDSIMAISRQRYLFKDLPAGDHVFYIDLAKSLSVQERKLFRQMREYQVMGGLLKDSNQDAVVRCNVAPDTWQTRAAIKRGFRQWNLMIKEGMEGLGPGLVKPKYLDYKVYLNQGHGPGPLLPSDAAGNELDDGDWVYSTYHTEDVDWSNYLNWTTPNRDTDSFQAMIVGPHLPGGGAGDHWNRIGLIQSWIQTRAFPDPSGQPVLQSTISEDPLANLFDEADAADEIIDMLNSDNDRTPYPEAACFGVQQTYSQFANLQRVAFAATQQGAGQVSALNGFSALCGLVQVHLTTTGQTGDVELILDVNMKGMKI